MLIYKSFALVYIGKLYSIGTTKILKNKLAFNFLNRVKSGSSSSDFVPRSRDKIVSRSQTEENTERESLAQPVISLLKFSWKSFIIVFKCSLYCKSSL